MVAGAGGVGEGNLDMRNNRMMMVTTNTNTTTATTTLKTPTVVMSISSSHDVEDEMQQQKHDSSLNLMPGGGGGSNSNDRRSKRQSSIHNPHLAFDPTIPPSERNEDGSVSRSAKGTLERRSALQQQQQPEQQDGYVDEALAGSVRRMTVTERNATGAGVASDAGSGAGSLRGHPELRKRRSLHQGKQK